MVMNNIKPIFIVGCPRSGTTLLASRINLHSEIVVTPETHFFEILNNSFLIKTKYRLTPEGIYNIIYSSRMKDLQIDFDIFMEIYKQTEQTYINIFDSCMNVYRVKTNKAYWCEKTPQHLKYLKDIFYYYPNAKVICILRDGRDVALSLSKVPWYERNIATCSMKWNEYISYFNRAKLIYSKKNFFSLKFEDFVRYPENILNSICDFLEIDFERSLLESFRNKSNIVPVWETEWKNNVTKPINNKMVGKWKLEATDFYKKLMSTIMRVNLHKLEYDNIELSINSREKIRVKLSIAIAKVLKIILDFLGRYSRFRGKKYHPF